MRHAGIINERPSRALTQIKQTLRVRQLAATAYRRSGPSKASNLLTMSGSDWLIYIKATGRSDVKISMLAAMPQLAVLRHSQQTSLALQLIKSWFS